MRLPHIIDYIYSDDDLLLDAKVKLAIIDEVLFDNKYEKRFKIRLIHHFRLQSFFRKAIYCQRVFLWKAIRRKRN